jgi:hypothetical protein
MAIRNLRAGMRGCRVAVDTSEIDAFMALARDASKPACA